MTINKSKKKYLKLIKQVENIKLPDSWTLPDGSFSYMIDEIKIVMETSLEPRNTYDLGFWYYNLHNFNHIINVVAAISDFIDNNLILSNEELYILVIAALGHDIGMSKWEINLEKLYKRELKTRSSNDYRRPHSIVSGIILEEILNKYYHNQNSNLIGVIGEIASGHSSDNFNATSISIDNINIRRGLLIGILKICDLFDSSATRLPNKRAIGDTIALASTCGDPFLSQIDHYIRRFLVRSCGFENNKVQVTVRGGDLVEFNVVTPSGLYGKSYNKNAIESFKNLIGEYLKEFGLPENWKEIVNEYSFLDEMLYKKNPTFGRSKKMIKEAFSFKWALKTIGNKDTLFLTNWDHIAALCREDFDKTRHPSEILLNIDSLSQKKNKVYFNIPVKRNLLLTRHDSFSKGIKEILENDQYIIVYGMSGTGKTEIAIDYAYENKRKYPGGIFFISSEYSLEYSLRKIFGTFEFISDDNKINIDKSNYTSLLTFIRTFLELRGDSLFILDNLNDSSYIDDILTLGAKLIVTTQMVSTKYQSICLDSLLEDSNFAFRIIISYSGKNVNELTEDEKKYAYKICKRIGNLPIGCEILGKQAKKRGFVNLGKDIDDFINLKTDTHNKGKITLIDSLEISSKKFDIPLTKKILLLISYFDSDNVDPTIISDVLNESTSIINNSISELLEMSLLKSKRNGGYSIHRLIQEAARKLDRNNEMGKTFLNWLQNQKKEPWKSGHLSTVFHLIPHMFKIASFSHKGLNTDEFPSDEKVFDLAQFMYKSGYLSNIDQLLSISLKRLQKSHLSSNNEIIERFNSLSMTYWYKGNYSKALEIIDLAHNYLPKSRDVGSIENFTMILNTKALTIKNMGEKQNAINLYRKIFLLDQKILEQIILSPKGPYSLAKVTLNFLKFLNKNFRNKGMKISSYFKCLYELESKSLKFNKKHEDSLREVAKHFNNYGVVLREIEDYHKSEPFFLYAHKITEIIKGKADRKNAFHLSNLAIVKTGLNLFEESNELFQEELFILESSNTRNYNRKLTPFYNPILTHPD